MYVSVRGQVGLRLEVVVVADEVLDRVVGEELLELLVELGGERLVVRHDQGRLLYGLDQLRCGEGLAGAGGAQQHLVLRPRVDAIDERGDRRRLVTGRLERGMDLQVGHGDPILDDPHRSHSERPPTAYTCTPASCVRS